MVHGLGGTSNTFTPLVGVYAGRNRVIRPDLPGSGRSATPEAMDLDSIAEGGSPPGRGVHRPPLARRRG